ncbi:hypothetical protein R4R77_003892 [Citrobacter amalonaticus]|jgi:chorismate synthase|uniref:Uncharacterized protein n=1 Tax=Citrobacter amalonaticus TaxID=35703 RepID=A0A8B3ZN74_CITAM|nr:MULTISPECIES: hypothetical protein [Citrobacter]EKW5059615.1 hypothetical protein [Citrobacter amalonaticus]EKX8495341.1 hypothetical protein [Citrobacter amalonaticus]ELR9584184.1 hypothetical protein [Citrobacter amalonaticus]MBC6536085.1 hypothetical protein [Citrobacter amalonaticus]MBE0131827.1 hypothetical protein [Citrobacter amalonaticus]
MGYGEDKAGLIVNALGLAVVDLIAAGVPITKDNLVEQLVRNQQDATKVIEKKTNRDAAELVRKGQ